MRFVAGEMEPLRYITILYRRDVSNLVFPCFSLPIPLHLKFRISITTAACFLSPITALFRYATVSIFY